MTTIEQHKAFIDRICNITADEILDELKTIPDNGIGELCASCDTNYSDRDFE